MTTVGRLRLQRRNCKTEIHTISAGQALPCVLKRVSDLPAKDIPSARFYLDAFNRRVKNPLVSTFGEHPDRLPPIAMELYGATTSSLGDVSVQIQAFQKVPITLVIWKGDEEFPCDGTILFDSSIKDMLSAEDISELTSQVVYPMIAKAQ